MSRIFQTVLTSSLEKVFPDRKPIASFYKEAIVFKNETFNFQLAYYTHEVRWFHETVFLQIDSPLKEYIKISEVRLVPSDFPYYPCEDEDYLITSPGMLPDLLTPLEEQKIKILPRQWRSLWFEVVLVEQLLTGSYPITIRLLDEKDQVIGEEKFNLEILEAKLPKQRVLHTEWFHTDCIAQFYKVPVFSQAYWEYVEAYMQCMSQNGMNMVLTPLFTPPLDTEVGKERLTVQLVDITLEKGQYRFNFSNLRRWVKLALGAGIEYFEMAHLFTQWGAYFTPKIVVEVEGERQALFGWHVKANDESYKVFLDQFLPELKQFLKDEGIEEKCYFHISDEPEPEHLKSYTNAYTLVHKYLEDYPILDALSNLTFYKKGLIKRPACSNDHIEFFLEEQVPHLWTYYCCMQRTQVSNRFMALPSYRNRILGVQLYKYKIEGFLHWGYNFWNTKLSKKAIDPFYITDAGGNFPSGDAFLVYPGERGPLESIRLKVLAEAFNDIRALELLETLISRDEVIQMIEKELQEDLTFKSYPRNCNSLLAFRQRVNELIKDLSRVTKKSN